MSSPIDLDELVACDVCGSLRVVNVFLSISEENRRKASPMRWHELAGGGQKFRYQTCEACQEEMDAQYGIADDDA